jgi:vacuolar-type H+-ATPase subunit C/Vma6
LFEEAAKATDLKTVVVAFRKKEYSLALKLGLKRYEETGSTISFDVLLDREYFENLCDAYQTLPKNEKKHALFYVSMEVDSFVMLMLLRGKALNYDAQWLRVAVPKCTFNLPKETLDSLITAPDYDSALNVALKSHYGGLFAKAQTPEETISNAQKSFTRELLKHASESRYSENFNVGAPLSFIFQKAAEVRNLTTISLGIEEAMTSEEILSVLLLPD